MATIKDGEKTERKKSVLATTPMTFHAGIPAAESRPFGMSKWKFVMMTLIEQYETNQVPILEDGAWAWCLVQQYGRRVGAKNALDQLESDGHPWSVELNVKPGLFEFEARPNHEGSGLYVRVKGQATQATNE